MVITLLPITIENYKSPSFGFDMRQRSEYGRWLYVKKKIELPNFFPVNFGS